MSSSYYIDDQLSVFINNAIKSGNTELLCKVYGEIDGLLFIQTNERGEPHYVHACMERLSSITYLQVVERVYSFWSCYTNLSIHVDIQKTIPDHWVHEVTGYFRHQTEQKVWLKFRIDYVEGL